MYQRGPVSTAYKVFDKNSINTSGGAIKDQVLPDRKLAETL